MRHSTVTGRGLGAIGARPGRRGRRSAPSPGDRFHLAPEACADVTTPPCPVCGRETVVRLPRQVMVDALSGRVELGVLSGTPATERVTRARASVEVYFGTGLHPACEALS